MKQFKNGFYILLLLVLSISVSCKDDDDDLNIIAGLDFVIATLSADGTEVGVLPSTVPPDGRIVYTVDFGAATDESDVFQTSGPMVTYNYPSETATYTITVNASLPGRDDVSITKEHTVIVVVPPPPASDNPLVGTWKLASESGAIGVGPAMDDVSWWSNTMDDVATRSCLFDDEYIFNADNSFQNVLGADTWVEAWQGVEEGCGAPVAPHNGTAEADFSHTLEIGTPGTVTINGTGAFLGIAKAYNGGELASPSEAPDSITYQALLVDANTLELDIEIAGGGYWSFKLEKEVPAIVGTWKLAPESAAIGVGPEMNNVSWWSNSTDDVTTRACLFDDEYVFNADGSFQNVLGADTWLETWQGAEEGCGTPVAPHDGSASASYTYDETAGTITIDGTGVFLGIAKAYNGGELASPSDAPSSITYIADFSDDGNTIELDIEIAEGGYWSFKLARQ